MSDRARAIPASTLPRALVVGASETAALLHLPILASLQRAGRIDLVEICDLRATAAADLGRRFDFTRAGSDAVGTIGRPDIDIVYLFGTAQLHHTLGLAALEAGKHLFVEKPIAPSYAKARALADAARANGLVAVGGHNRRFLGGLQRLRASAGGAGWSYAEAVFHKPDHGRPPPFGAASWLSGNGVHALDALVHMMGGLPDLMASQAGGREGRGVFSAMMTWPGGAQGMFLCDNEAGERREEYAFHAPGKSWRLTEAGLTVRRNGGPPEDFGPSPFEDSFAAEHDAFLAAVAGGPPPPNTIAALAPSLFLAELIETGHHGPVRLPPATAHPAPLAREHTVLVVGPDRLRPALGAMPGTWRLISPADLDRSSALGLEVTAAILGQGAEPLSEVMLDRLPNLAAVGVVGLSLARYAPDRLLARGVTLVNASHAYAESVAEFALGLAILGRRRAFVGSRAMQHGDWGVTPSPRGLAGLLLGSARLARRGAARLGVERPLRRMVGAHPALAALSPPPGASRDLAGAVVGLVGWGANANAFARRLIAAGARVIVYSDHAGAAEIQAVGAEPAGLAAVLAADIVSLHRGLTPATHHGLGAAELDRLRPGAVLINVARGALIEPDALVARLRRGDITACLDTFEEEPLPRRHPLRRLPNVFLTPHIAGGSPDMHAAAAREVIAKLAGRLDGAAVVTVTADRLATMT